MANRPVGLGGADFAVSSMDSMSYCCPAFLRPRPVLSSRPTAILRDSATKCGLAANKEWTLLLKLQNQVWF